MKIKTSICIIEIDEILIVTIITVCISKILREFLHYFFACYLFILIHELSHILVASILNKRVLKIELSIFGVAAVLENKKTKNSCYDSLIYLAGPISNFILAILFVSNNMISSVNIFLGILNLVPIYPLDGYNILRNLVSKYRNSRIITELIDTLILISLFIACGYQFYNYRNISLFVFFAYLIILKMSKK